jgi:hypothetical protein
VKWILTQAWREVPQSPRKTAHFHINLLADARSVAHTRAIMDAYLQYLHENGEKRVFGQMVVFEDRRGTKMFERYGFKVLNKAEITKYRDIHPHPGLPLHGDQGPRRKQSALRQGVIARGGERIGGDVFSERVRSIPVVSGEVRRSDARAA